MSKIGIIGAMPEEIEILQKKLENVSESQNAGWTYYHGQMHGKKVVLVKCGVGKVNAAIVTHHLINNLGASVVINSGVAGAVDSSLNIGDIVISEDAVHHDMDATGFGYAPGQIPQFKTIAFAANPLLVKIASTEPNTKVGRVASGDQFVTDKAIKEKIRDHFEALCVEMEGAAIAQVCYLHSTPFVIIRSISDKADGEAVSDFSENLYKSIDAYTAIVEKIIREVPDEL
ncbi:MAG: 5'-methylthioadenosine/adenosylhomocysteine nucleosidase [Defluviitaleaceae bacterium]|nr:5'-methylthioadenosine/adenosylhomocysteine nucleosidase [Defluviitaleaceae bacterium]